jgi:hypothetical protein
LFTTAIESRRSNHWLRGHSFINLLEALELSTFEAFKFPNFLKLMSRLKPRATNKETHATQRTATHRGCTFETLHLHASVHLSVLRQRVRRDVVVWPSTNR